MSLSWFRNKTLKIGFFAVAIQIRVRVEAENYIIPTMRISLLFALFFSILPPAVGASVPASLTAAMQKYKIPSSSVSVLVTEVDNNQPLVSLNAEVPRNPASVMKLVTTLAALEILGPSYTWKTDYYLDGQLHKGQLDGDLIIKGHGDPYLVLEQFWRHLTSLRERGLQKINGNLGIDNAAFAPPPHDPGAFDGEPFRLYNVGAAATVVNFNATRFGFYPHDGIVNIIVDPPMPNLTVVDHLRAKPGRCRGKESGWSHQIQPQPDKALITFSGKYSSGCGDYNLRRSVLPTDDYVFGAFKTTWTNIGGDITGNKVLRQAQKGQKPFVVGDSKTLSEVVKGTNKYSNNLMARQLLMTLGLHESGAPATEESGVAAINNWLNQQQLAMPELVIDNGAGLSRDIRISATSLANLLKHGWASNYQPEFMSSLSLAAIDGTTRKRLTRLHPDGRIRAKTGYLKSIRTVAGYVKGDSGKNYAVVLFINDPKIQFWSGNAIQDALLSWVIKQ